MRCPTCTAENAATRRFCAQCGAALPVPCRACGFENETAARFCGGCGRPIGVTGAPEPAIAPPSPRADSAERRQLTVMFCDLVGSTPLSTRFDPEDLREIVGAYHGCVTDTVGRFGGFVAKYMGDGVLIYFGYPEAHEDDAERAARAGLSVIDAVGRLAIQEPLKRPDRHRYRPRRRRRPDRGGRGARAGRGRRDAKPRRPSAGAGPAWHPGRCRQHPATNRQAVRDPGSRAAGARRFCRAAARLASDRRERGLEPLRGVAFGERTAHRPRRGARPLVAAMAAGEVRRRAGGAGLRRTRDRQVAADRGPVGAYRERAAYPTALFLLAARSGKRALPVYRPAGARRGVRS